MNFIETFKSFVSIELFSQNHGWEDFEPHLEDNPDIYEILLEFCAITAPRNLFVHLTIKNVSTKDSVGIGLGIEMTTNDDNRQKNGTPVLVPKHMQKAYKKLEKHLVDLYGHRHHHNICVEVEWTTLPSAHLLMQAAQFQNARTKRKRA